MNLVVCERFGNGSLVVCEKIAIYHLLKSAYLC